MLSGSVDVMTTAEMNRLVDTLSVTEMRATLYGLLAHHTEDTLTEINAVLKVTR